MLLPAITWLHGRVFFYSFIIQFLIMRFDNSGYILGATVAHLGWDLIRYFLKLVGVWEVVT